MLPPLHDVCGATVVSASGCRDRRASFTSSFHSFFQSYLLRLRCNLHAEYGTATRPSVPLSWSLSRRRVHECLTGGLELASIGDTACLHSFRRRHTQFFEPHGQHLHVPTEQHRPRIWQRPPNKQPSHDPLLRAVCSSFPIDKMQSASGSASGAASTSASTSTGITTPTVSVNGSAGTGAGLNTNGKSRELEGPARAMTFGDGSMGGRAGVPAESSRASTAGNVHGSEDGMETDLGEYIVSYPASHRDRVWCLLFSANPRKPADQVDFFDGDSIDGIPCFGYQYQRGFLG